MKSQNSNNNQKERILNIFLQNPFDFWEIIERSRHVSRKKLIENIKNSIFREYFQSISDNDIIHIKKMFEKEIRIIHDWIQNSDIRVKTFYYIGKRGPITASEIGNIIEKHPKSVSTYINEFFNEKGWIELIPDDDARTKRYNLSELGESYYNFAQFDGWFDLILDEEFSIEVTILNVEYDALIEIIDMDEEEAPIIPEVNLSYEMCPQIFELIRQIEIVGKKIVKKINLEMTLPNLSDIDDRKDLVSIDTVDKDKLAIIFAVFNYLRKNPFYVHDVSEDLDLLSSPKINKIKFIRVDSYFDENLPDRSNEEGFLSIEETKKFISKTLSEFRKNWR